MGTEQIFKRDDGSAITFDIIFLSEKASDEMTRIIEDNGGAVEHDDHGAIFFTKNKSYVASMLPGKRLYNIAYILDCVQEEMIIDPAPYRIGMPDADDDRAIRAFLSGRPAHNAGFNNLAGGDGMHNGGPNLPIDLADQPSDDDDVQGEQENGEPQNQDCQGAAGRNEQRPRRGRGRRMSHEDDVQILNYLMERQFITAAVQGLTVWNQMLNDGLFPRRTANSLYCHFKFRILPRIDQFAHLTDAQRGRFQRVARGHPERENH